MNKLPEVYIVRGTYTQGPKSMLGKPCSVSHWTRYERHDAVMRQAATMNPWMRVQSVQRYTGATYGGLPLSDLREAMAKHVI